jgi:hypothetical protein
MRDCKDFFSEQNVIVLPLSARHMTSLLGWFQWSPGCISLLPTSHQLSLSLSPTTAPAAGYSIQPTTTSASVTATFSLSGSTTISDLTILEFIL